MVCDWARVVRMKTQLDQGAAARTWLQLKLKGIATDMVRAGHVWWASECRSRRVTVFRGWLCAPQAKSTRAIDEERATREELAVRLQEERNSRAFATEEVRAGSRPRNRMATGVPNLDSRVGRPLASRSNGGSG